MNVNTINSLVNIYGTLVPTQPQHLIIHELSHKLLSAMYWSLENFLSKPNYCKRRSEDSIYKIDVNIQQWAQSLSIWNTKLFIIFDVTLYKTYT